MDLDTLVQRRRMCRSFIDEPVPPDVLDRVLDRARRAPSAGHSQGWAFVVLDNPTHVRAFWEHDASPGWLSHPSHPGLLGAPVIVLPLACERLYLERYSEPDKIQLGRNEASGWPVPYWLVDTAFATMMLLLSAANEGLGALFFALHQPPGPLLRSLGVPEGWEPIGAVALGWPDPLESSTGSAGRGWRPLQEVVHKGSW